MLTISKPLSASQAQSYHAKEFTAKEQSYWSQRGEIAGEWQGQLAARFGLSGPVSSVDFARLSQGQNPVTGEQLVGQRSSYEYRDADGKRFKTMEHRAGWDATFSAPKSVSVTALVGGDERVRDAHRESVGVALDQLEHYAQARIGGNHPAETTGKLVAAKFEHDTARPVDGYVAPQLHTHVVIFNLTERENGQARAVQPQSLFASQQFATAIYQAELTYRLRQLGYEITTGRSGAPEIKGYTQEYLDASSPRSQQIREYLERTGHSGKEAAEIAAHSTRDRKEIHPPGKVMAAHRKLAADFGHQAEHVVRAARDRLEHGVKPVDGLDRVRESVTFSRDKNFEREAVVDERVLIRDGLRRGMGDVTYIQIRSNFDARLGSGEFQLINSADSSSARRLTTARTIAAEQEVIRRVQDGRSQVDPVMTRYAAIEFAERDPSFTRSQKSVVEAVLTSPDRIQGIQGYAGTGKTTALFAIRGAAESAGFEVIGFAPTSRAARQLKEAGIDSGTLQAFLTRPRETNSQDQRHFYFVDESSLASTNQMRDFLARVGANDRVLLIGDTRQHQGVEAGRPFEQLQSSGMRTAHLDEIVRQTDLQLKSAVEMFAKGQVSSALSALHQQRRIAEIPDNEIRIRTIAARYVEAPDKTLIVSPDNASRRQLNMAVREELKGLGKVAPDDHTFRILVQRQDMTGAERAWASHYEVNDVVRYSRGSVRAGIEAGGYSTVVAVNSSSNLLTVEQNSGERTTYDPRRLAGVSVYRECASDFSSGDRIQFTAPYGSLGVANRDLAVIESIARGGEISARLENGRRINFDPAEHRHFDHGYAVTSHSSQGLTAERVLVNADTSVNPALLNSRFGYVSISRASHEATVFTNNTESLNRMLGAEVSKTSALDVRPAETIQQEIAMHA